IPSLTEASAEQITTIRLDIAKFVFHAHGADAAGQVLLRKRLIREPLCVHRQCPGASPVRYELALIRSSGRSRTALGFSDRGSGGSIRPMAAAAAAFSCRS